MTPLKKRCEIENILSLLSSGFTRNEIMEKTGLKPSALSNHLRRLEEADCIKRKGNYDIKVLRNSYLHPRVTKNRFHNKLNKRGHAFNSKLIFPLEKDLKNKKEVKHEFKIKKISQLSFGSYKLIKDRNSIWINKDSFTVYSNNSYYSGNALHSRFAQLKDLDKLAIYLKDRYNLKGKYGIEVFREHYGLILNKFSKWILGQGKKMYVKNEKNKTIIWVDDSRKDDIGLKEFESGNPILINNADNFFESKEKTGWKDDTPKVEDNTKRIDGQEKVIEKSMKILEGYAEQIALHLEVEKRTNKILEKLEKKIK